MKRSSLILLIFCNLIWALNPLMGKTLLASFTGVQVAWIRYFSGSISFLLFASVSVLVRRGSWSDYFLIPRQLRTWLEIGIVGLGPFVFAPIMQFVGLETAQVIDNSILIATEPLMTVLLAWAVLGEKMSREHAVSITLALLGFLFFSGILGTHSGALVSMGMIFLIFAQFGESTYSVFTRKLVRDYSPAAILGTALTIGVSTLTGFVLIFDRLPDLSRFSTQQIAATVWLGPIGSALTYLIWAMIARSVSVPAMAITLFIQPVVGALAGYLLMGERLTVLSGFGAFLILAAIAYLSWKEMRRSSNFAQK